METLAEGNLCVAVPAAHPLAGHDSVDVSDLHGQRWIASRASGDEPQLGVWPGLDGRPDIAHTSRDWLTKLQLVAAGCGMTTVPAVIAAAAPAGVRVLAVRGGPEERRRVIVAHLPHRLPEAALHVVEALRAAAIEAQAP
jgi:DNA-binding transcriptional LysR family regulator